MTPRESARIRRAISHYRHNDASLRDRLNPWFRDTLDMVQCRESAKAFYRMGSGLVQHYR